MSCESIQACFISWHATSAIASCYALLPTEHLSGRHLRPPLLSLPPMFRPRKKSAHHVPLERTHRKAWLPCWGAKAAAEVAQRAARARESLTMVGVGGRLFSHQECIRLRSGRLTPAGGHKNIARAADHVTDFCYEVFGKSKRYAVGSVMIRKCRKGSARSPGKDTHINTSALNVPLPVLDRRLPTPHAFYFVPSSSIGHWHFVLALDTLLCCASLRLCLSGRNICTHRQWRASYSWR